MNAPDPFPRENDIDQKVLAAFRRLATALRRSAVELRGPVLGPESGLHEAGQAVDELADLMAIDVTQARARTWAAELHDALGDIYDQDPEG
jgi:hypothetical protein